MIFDQFPYTNFHEMNDDWILKTLRQMSEQLDAFVAANSLTYADPIMYDPDTTYAANTVVIYATTAYVSKKAAPAGVLPTNTDYWLSIFPFGDLINAGIAAGVEDMTTLINTAIAGIPAMVNTWMESHPEVTTTVQTGSVTFQKLYSALQGVILNNYASDGDPKYISEFTQGAIGEWSGEVESASACRTNFIKFPTGIIRIRAASGYRITVFKYKYQTSWTGSTIVLSDVETDFGAFAAEEDFLYRIVIKKTTLANFTPQDLPENPVTYYAHVPIYAEGHTVTSDLVKEIQYARSALTAGIMQPSGTVTSSSAVGYPATPFPVDPGDVMTVKTFYINNSGYLVGIDGTFRACAFFTNDPATYVSRGFTTSRSSVRIPSDIHYAQPSISAIMTGTYTIAVIYLTKANGMTKRYMVQNGYKNPVQFIGNVPASTRVLVGNVLSVDDYIMTATIKFTDPFTGFTIGAATNAGSSIQRPYLKITPTTIEMKSGTDSSWDLSVAHGLTIQNDLQVILIQKNSSLTARVILQSNGQRYESPTTWRFGSVYQRFAFYTYQAINAAVSISVPNLNKDVWVCGDSWAANFDTRWYGQALNLGIVNFLKSGHAGEGSKDGLEHLKTLLEMKTPKMILWLYGMNDADPDDASPNTDWLAAFNDLKTICEDRYIDLILATIPTTPTMNNNAKNAIVKASGYRYVDQESAMGADTSGNWYAGYQSDDGNHTTVAGARALLAQFLADAPEIALS